MIPQEMASVKKFVRMIPREMALLESPSIRPEMAL
jgi:hypothetical protein